MKTIELTRGYVALVSDKDYKRVSQLKWCASENFVNGKLWNVYAVRGFRVNGKCKTHLMHRFILGIEYSKVPAVDHYPDSSGLNNQRSNLRLATSTENHQNSKLRSDSTSGYKGATWDTAHHKWLANIKVNHKQMFLGYFTTPKEAALAYDKAARKHFGKFARTNKSLGLL